MSNDKDGYRPRYSMQNVSQEDQSWSAFVSELEATSAEKRSTIAGLENSLKRAAEELAQAHRAIERLVERGANAYLHERIQALEKDRAQADIELTDAHDRINTLEAVMSNVQTLLIVLARDTCPKCDKECSETRSAPPPDVIVHQEHYDGPCEAREIWNIYDAMNNITRTGEPQEQPCSSTTSRRLQKTKTSPSPCRSATTSGSQKNSKTPRKSWTKPA